MTDNVVQLRPQPYSFDLFWEQYPKKHSIGPARAQWMWALAKVNNDASVLIEGAKRYADYCRRQGTEDRYIAKAGNWLYEERWLDVYETAHPSPDRTEEARIRALHAQWWGGQDTAFKAQWRRDRISEADKAAMRRLGLLV